MSDPEGFGIELLQTTFEKNFLKRDVDDSCVLGQKGCIGMTTIRVNDIEESLRSVEMENLTY